MAYHTPPHKTKPADNKTSFQGLISSMLNTITSNTATPIADALLPNNKNIEKIKLKITRITPVKMMFLLVKPTIMDTMNNNAMVINMALRLWCMGPGVSTILTQMAPNDKVIPYCNIPKCAKINGGQITPKVMRNPSTK